jgi:deoxyadenosine/deoxycytidine kinase
MAIIAVDGVLAIGKTTLVKELARRPGYQAALEPVTGASPLLAAYYRAPATYACTFQLFVLMQRAAQHMQAQLDQSRVHLFDRSLLGDLTFATLHIAEGNISGAEAALYLDTFRRLTESLDPPDLIVWLDAPSEMVLERIHKRGREAERTVTLDYLEKARQAHAHAFKDNVARWNDKTVPVVKLLWSAFTSADDVERILRSHGVAPTAPAHDTALPDPGGLY